MPCNESLAKPHTRLQVFIIEDKKNPSQSFQTLFLQGKRLESSRAKINPGRWEWA
jgi:hypothetical protein